MLTLNEGQWAKLKAHDEESFEIAVCEQFLATRREMLETPGRSAILIRMQEAHAYGMRARFTSTPHIVHLMYLSADAPGIHDDPVVDAHLRRPGASPEQRLDDLLAVVAKELDRLEKEGDGFSRR